MIADVRMIIIGCQSVSLNYFAYRRPFSEREQDRQCAANSHDNIGSLAADLIELALRDRKGLT